MDPMKSMIKRKELRPWKKAVLQLLLQLSLVSILYHYTPYLQCFLQSIRSNLFVGMEAMFIFCISIILFLAMDFRFLSYSVFPHNFHYKYSSRIEGDHQPSGADSVEIEAHVGKENVATENDNRNEHFTETGDVQPRSEDYIEGNSVFEKAIVEIRVGTFEVDAVEGAGIGEEIMEDSGGLEVLCTEELNRIFEEFIAREKQKMRLENLQLVKV